MSYGMTYDQFWYGDPCMAKAYYECQRIKNKRKNEEMWVNGIYTLHALNVALNNAFNKHKIQYLAKPLDIYPKTEAEVEAERNEKINKVIRWLDSLKTGKK